MITGADLRAARVRAQLSQEDLARKVGASLRTIGNWEHSTRVPRDREESLRAILGEYLDDQATTPRLRTASDLELLAEMERRLMKARSKTLEPYPEVRGYDISPVVDS